MTPCCPALLRGRTHRAHRLRMARANPPVVVIRSRRRGGAWEDPRTWVGGVVPTLRGRQRVVLRGEVTVGRDTYADLQAACVAEDP